MNRTIITRLDQNKSDLFCYIKRFYIGTFTDANDMTLLSASVNALFMLSYTTSEGTVIK